MARSVALLLATVALLVAGPAEADQSLHATGTLSTGFTNNILGVPETDMTVVQSDAFANISPGVLFSYESPRFRAQVRYALTARLFFRQSTANSFSNFLNIRGATDISATSNIELAASAAAGRINAFDSDPVDAELDLPDGDIAYARVLGSALYTKQISWPWRYRQTVEGGAFTPTDETVSINTNWSFGGTAALERSWKRHQVTWSMEGKYVHNERVDPADPSVRIDPDLQVIVGPRVRWLWDISGSFSSALSAGVVRVFDPDDFETGLYQPQVSAQVAYLKERSVVSLRYGHGVNTNSLVGQTSTVDRVELRGFYPTAEILEDSGLTGTLAYQHAQFVDVQSEELSASSDQGAADIAATWRQYEGLSWALRYQYSRRTRGVAVLGSTEETSRHQVQLMLTVRYPDRQAVELPERNSDRVDEGSDENELQRQQSRR